MAVIRYCWRLGENVPMLSDAEWTTVVGRFSRSGWLAKGLSLETGLDVEYQYAMAAACRAFALDKYVELTGHRLRSAWSLYEVRNSRYGADCVKCAKPLRTPRASFCAACGTPALQASA